MSDLPLRYGLNPHQRPARAFARHGQWPLSVLNGAPGYINLLDALNAWQLVADLRTTLGLPAAASFKHVSPSGAAVGLPLDERLRRAYFVEDLELSPLATAYARARGADRISSFGDWVAFSDLVDVSAARLLRREVSDGVIAPGFEEEALRLLRDKRGGQYVVLQVDSSYTPDEIEQRDVFGITLEQRRNTVAPDAALLSNVVTLARDLPEHAIRDLVVALTALKYAQSNSVCLARDGQVIGLGAGQQSRIHCTRLAASKADTWYLRQHPRLLGLRFREGLARPERDNAVDLFLRDDLSPAEQTLLDAALPDRPAPLGSAEKREWLDTLSGVSLASDAFFPFRDNIDRAHRSGVGYLAQPGGSLRDADIIAACDEYAMTMAFTGVRLFTH